jgi:hypothetical protein
LPANGLFAALPARPVLDQQSQQKRDINGKPQYAAFIEWRDRSLSGRFFDTVVALVLEAHPGAFDGDPLSLRTETASS